ncbi:unnamed protein product [Ostreobium quekettii]|uniref:JmjC domain-containing protein n=1 Tax=Ostreobium quekettii TaxID=121088 RepID=A0A8S1J5K8_9CHLO|nr:unnamed protein product [Ostreobium quekettii]
MSQDALLRFDGRVAVLQHVTEQQFCDHVLPARLPVVLKGLDIGCAPQQWTPAYLRDLPSSQATLVGVHVSTEPSGCLNFVNRNFVFKTMSLSELVARCTGQKMEPLIGNGERYYLRSIGANPRKEPSSIEKSFPDLARSLNLPQLFPADSEFSSVLRITSPGVRLWTHFDVMDNFLVQIRGTKRVQLWSPDDEENLYVQGSSSEVMDVDDPDLARYPLFAKACRWKCELQPGDVLFIPALWFHNVYTEEFSVSANVFWRQLPKNMYDKKDLYGNRDPIPATEALKAIDAAAAKLLELPNYYRQFYCKRLQRQLGSLVDAGACGECGIE